MSEKIGEYGRISLHRTNEGEKDGPRWTVRQETFAPDGMAHMDMVTMDATEAGWLMATLEAELGVLRSEPDTPVFREEAADFLADELVSLAGRVRQGAGAESRHRGMGPEWWEDVAGELLKLAVLGHRLSAGTPQERGPITRGEDR